MTTVHTLASGSSGNALAFTWDGGALLLDAGISCRRIQTALHTLGLGTEDLRGILITHTHTDHVYGLQTLLKRTGCPVLASERACRELDYRFAGIRERLFPLPLCQRMVWRLNSPVPEETDTESGAAQTGLSITAFPASHDAPGTVGFRLDTPDGGFGFLTDSGCVTEEAQKVLPGVRFVLLEANHDIEAVRSGPYPYYLKERILGPWGHLCNEEAGAFAAELACAGAERILLAHLSAENNTPAMALAAVRRALEDAGQSPSLDVAPRDRLFPAYRAGTPDAERSTAEHSTAEKPESLAAENRARYAVPFREAALCGG